MLRSLTLRHGISRAARAGKKKYTADSEGSSEEESEDEEYAANSESEEVRVFLMFSCCTGIWFGAAQEGCYVTSVL